MTSAVRPPTYLHELRLGQRARIVAVAGPDSLVQRLLEMGLLDGEEIEVIGFAPLGDPMEIRLCDYRLSLRRREAACITVEVLSASKSAECLGEC